MEQDLDNEEVRPMARATTSKGRSYGCDNGTDVRPHNANKTSGANHWKLYFGTCETNTDYRSMAVPPLQQVMNPGVCWLVSREHR